MKFILRLLRVDLKRKRVGIIKQLMDAVVHLEENSVELEVVNHGLRDKVIKIEEEIDSNFTAITRNSEIIKGLKSIGF